MMMWRQRRRRAAAAVRVCLLTCLWSLVAPGGMAFAGQEALEVLRDGIQLVEDGDYAAAIEVLETAAGELEANRAAPRDLARSYFYAGVARVFIVGDDEALFAFQEAQRRDPQFRPAETEFPRRVMHLWEEAERMEVEPEPAGGPAAGVLTVTTQPAGATVYVAGRRQGSTPVEIAGLPAGEHRVTIVRDGYVNNSRLMPLAPSRNELLNVELTPAAGGSGAAEMAEMQQETAAGGGGGGWWRWAALAGGGGAAALLLLPKNQPPVAGLNVSPSGSGMAGVTQYSFDGGSSSDPDNDSLTYSWNFGDGTTGSGVRASHVYASAGNYSVTLTVSDGKEQATTSGSVTVARNLDGNFRTPTYRLTINGNDTGLRATFSARFTQTGTNLAGTLTINFSGVATQTATVSISGRISGSNNFVCPCDVQFNSGSAYSFTGSINNGTTLLTGTDRMIIRDASGTSRTFRGDVEYRRQ